MKPTDELPYPESILELVVGMRPEAAAEILRSYERSLIRERKEFYEDLKKYPPAV